MATGDLTAYGTESIHPKHETILSVKTLIKMHNLVSNM